RRGLWPSGAKNAAEPNYSGDLSGTRVRERSWWLGCSRRTQSVTAIPLFPAQQRKSPAKAGPFF
ncbi:MAG: hypothetical protein ACPG3T_07065, partial [Pseudomonadales bacterium]